MVNEAMAKLEAKTNDVDGEALIELGLGIELFQLRMKNGFLQGLGSEVLQAIQAYIDAVQKSKESVGAYFARKKRLYEIAQSTEGCDFGSTAQKLFALQGLRHGAYHEVFDKFVSKILLGQSLVLVG